MHSVYCGVVEYKVSVIKVKKVMFPGCELLNTQHTAVHSATQPWLQSNALQYAAVERPKVSVHVASSEQDRYCHSNAVIVRTYAVEAFETTCGVNCGLGAGCQDVPAQEVEVPDSG